MPPYHNQKFTYINMKETGNWVHNINSCNASWHLYQQVKTNYQEQFLKIFSLAELEVKFGCGQCVHQFSLLASELF